MNSIKLEEAIALLDKLERDRHLEEQEWVQIIEAQTPELSEILFERARKIRIENFGNQVYIRGLIEYTNYCHNDCYYCGIRKSNDEVDRYCLTKEQILSCCETGYQLGFRTFVLQGGESDIYSDEALVDIIKAIKESYPDCALTLSLGEKSTEAYQAFYDAGADRYLLRHETAEDEHYQKLHPSNLLLSNRKKCLYELKKIGFQTGSGFMVGTPGQTSLNLAKDFVFLEELQPEMVGIGPFIPHHQTPFANETGGTLDQTLFMLGLLRLLFPKGLLPATTSLGTVDPKGREKGILAGANVVMPNLSPVTVRKKYELYDNKICTGDEAAECRACLGGRMKSIGYEVVEHRGDHPELQGCDILKIETF